jgi:hypothetical protein
MRELVTKWIAALALIVVAAVACGGSKSSGGSNGPGFSLGTPPLAQEPANVVGGFSVQLPAITLQPGEEKFPCFVFSMQITGPSHIVGGGSLTTSLGMHHGNVTSRPRKANDPTTDGGACPTDPNDIPGVGAEAFDILAGGSVLFASSTQITGTEWRTFPQGMGFRVKDQGFAIVAHMHYLNPSSQPVTVAPKYQWYTIDEGSVATVLSPFFWRLQNFSVPPHTQQTYTVECDLPAGMHIVNVLPHMHRLGTNFQVGFVGGPFDGQAFLDSPGYSPDKGVELQYDPAIDLSQSNGVTMSCTWNNLSDQVVTEGTGNNEMCMLFGYSYPGSATYTFSAEAQGPDMKPDPSFCAYVLAPQ